MRKEAGDSPGSDLCKAEMRLDLPETAAELAHFDPVRPRHLRNVLGENSDEQHSLMQDPVVLQVVQQGRGDVFSLRGEEDRRPRDAGFRCPFTGCEKARERYCLAHQPRRHQPTSCAPGGHDREDDKPNHQREPAATWDLQRICAE